MRFQLPLIGRLLTTFALLVAFATSGFAHSNAHTPLTPELALYVANGGSLSDICGHSGTPDAPEMLKCEACRLINAAILPSTEFVLPACMTGQTRRYMFVAKRLHHARPLDPARLTRAPPQA